MISWLKRYGLTILKDVGVVLGFLPAITQATNAAGNATVTKVTDTLTGIASIVQTVEAAFAAAFGGTAQTGAAKLQAIQPEVSTMVQQWLAASFPGTAHIQDQTLFAKGVSGLSQGVVDVLNSLGNNVTVTTPVTTSNPPAAVPVPQPLPAVAQ